MHMKLGNLQAVVTILIVLLSTSGSFLAQDTSSPNKDFCNLHGEYNPKKFFLKLLDEHKDQVPFSPDRLGHLSKGPFRSLVDELGVNKIEQTFTRLPQMSHYFTIHVSEDVDPERLVEAFESFDFVDFAERVPQHRLFLNPNDIHPINTAQPLLIVQTHGI